MPLIERVDVLRDVAQRGRIPAAIARREPLVRRRAEALALAGELGLVQPCASWRIVPTQVRPDDGTLCAEGHLLRAPRLIPEAGTLTGIACAVATLGPGIEEHVKLLFAQHRVALAVALDGVANELLFALTRRVQDRILVAARREGLTMAGELRAGDPGLALDAQASVLALAQAERIGVVLTRTSMMHPAKSASFVQGVGRELPPQSWSRCDECQSRARCTVAREPV